jgi:hypothetical protein
MALNHKILGDWAAVPLVKHAYGIDLDRCLGGSEIEMDASVGVSVRSGEFKTEILPILG